MPVDDPNLSSKTLGIDSNLRMTNPNSDLEPVLNQTLIPALGTQEDLVRTSLDPTTQKLSNPQPGTSPTYYYPSDLANPDIGNQGAASPSRNIMKFTIRDFKGGLLKTELKTFVENLKNKTSKDFNILTGDIKGNLKETATNIQNGTPFDAGVYNQSETADINQIWSHVRNTTESAVSSIDNQNVKNIVAAFTNTTPLTPDITYGTIFLYAPASIGASYALAYKEEDLTQVGQVLDVVNTALSGGEKGNTTDVLKQLGVTFVSNLASSVLGKVSGGLLGGSSGTFDLQKAINAKTRTVPVQNFEYLFERVARREFNFTYAFYPRSEEEAIQTGKIISAFKYYSHPGAASDSRYYDFPAVFEIEHCTWDENKRNWVPNLFLNKHKLCCLKSIDVNYTDAGSLSTLEAIKTRTDNSNLSVSLKSPVGISLKLSFVEIQILNRNDMTDPESFTKMTEYQNRYH